MELFDPTSARGTAFFLLACEVTCLDMEDPRHDFSKLYAGIDLAGKDFAVGKFFASHFDVVETARLADVHQDDHGCIKRFLCRTDKQSKTAPSVLTANKMRTCLEKAIRGDYGAKQPFEGTLAYTLLLHNFLLCFFGKKITGLDRVRFAGYVAGFLRRARWHVVLTPGLTLQVNFLSGQAYQHALFSVQILPLKLKAQRVFHPHLPTHVEETGSNAVEELWSSLGGFGSISSNQRDWDGAQALQRAEDLITLTKYESEGSGLNFGKEKNRATQRDLKVHLHENKDAPDVDQSAVYQDAELISSWVEGDEQAKAACEELGMKPSGLLSEAKNAWWEKPWLKEEEHISSMKKEEPERPEPGASAAGEISGTSASSNKDNEEEEEEDDDGEGEGEGEEEGSGSEDEGGVSTEDAAELSRNLMAASKEKQRKTSDPRVQLPGGGMGYKRTIVDAYNRDLHTKLDPSRLSRIKISTQQMNDIELVLMKRAQSQKLGGVLSETTAIPSAEAGSSGGIAAAAGSSSSGGAAAAGVTSSSSASSTEEISDMDEKQSLSVGDDAAFAMVIGPSHQWWIGRVTKLFRKSSIWRGSVPLEDGLPEDYSVICEWYSPIPRTNKLKFNFREITDRARFGLTFKFLFFFFFF